MKRAYWEHSTLYFKFKNIILKFLISPWNFSVTHSKGYRFSPIYPPRSVTNPNMFCPIPVRILVSYWWIELLCPVSSGDKSRSRNTRSAASVHSLQPQGKMEKSAASRATPTATGGMVEWWTIKTKGQLVSTLAAKPTSSKKVNW